ncbi:T9SS type A sorting domain-containing protein [Lentimicrobium sp. S6]|uniref:T9SS type A sorting domain-containing protein n=1 Tax=Lentimicrobium sp. S6 TaxID=2735872 RepID=UPI001558196D|nr:T9SS type A sorting domain-containing protein [Lentimicrobium sp. S6]NPD45250.1 T9SS type A sorting domain-containing protein [Lentimicrobium sp. S6]
MKKIFTILLIITASLQLSAQNFYFEPSNELSKVIGISSSSYLRLNILRNPAVDTVRLKYELVTNTIPDEWYRSYCDNHGCMSSLPEYGEMSPLFDEFTSYIELSFDPLYIDGSGAVAYYIYESGDYDNGQTMTFNVETEGFVGIEDRFAESIFISPNPFQNFINVSNDQDIQELNLYDITGKQIQTISTIASTQYTMETSQLNNGIYLLEIIDMFGNKTTRKLTKN